MFKCRRATTRQKVNFLTTLVTVSHMQAFRFPVGNTAVSSLLFACDGLEPILSAVCFWWGLGTSSFVRSSADNNVVISRCHRRELFLTIFIILHDLYCLSIMMGYYGFTLDVPVSVRPSVVRPASVFRFRMITWININGFSPNLVCALILWSGLGLLMGKFRQILTAICPRHAHIFSFPDDNLSK